MHDSEENKEKQVKGIPKKIKLQIIAYYQKKIKKTNIILIFVYLEQREE